MEALTSLDFLLNCKACVLLFITIKAFVAFDTFKTLAAPLSLLNCHLWNCYDFFSTALKIKSELLMIMLTESLGRPYI